MKHIEVSKDYLTELIFRAMPYAEQIKEWNTTEEKAVYFTWRDQEFKVTTTLNCAVMGSPLDEVDPRWITEGTDDTTIILEALLKKQYMYELVPRHA